MFTPTTNQDGGYYRGFWTTSKGNVVSVAVGYKPSLMEKMR